MPTPSFAAFARPLEGGGKHSSANRRLVRLPHRLEAVAQQLMTNEHGESKRLLAPGASGTRMRPTAYDHQAHVRSRDLHRGDWRCVP